MSVSRPSKEIFPSEGKTTSVVLAEECENKTLRALFFWRGPKLLALLSGAQRKTSEGTGFKQEFKTKSRTEESRDPGVIHEERLKKRLRGKTVWV